MIPQLDGREVKTAADFGIMHISFIFLFFDSKPGSCQPIYVIIILRIKALALQKRPLFVLFALVGRTADMNGWTFTHNNVLQRRAIQASTLDKSATIREKRKEFGEFGAILKYLYSIFLT